MDCRARAATSYRMTHPNTALAVHTRASRPCLPHGAAW